MSISREKYEFAKSTKIEALQRADHTCESCGKHEKEVGKLYVHHKLMIEMAIRYYPELSNLVIKSLANAECLCQSCHLKRDNQAREEHRKFALTLQLMERFQQVRAS